MNDHPHDGPISQGIRDAILASDETPYSIAKKVTARGTSRKPSLKLTPPQIYRFLHNKAGLSLVLLDEIATVLGLEVHVVPEDERKAVGSPYRIVVHEGMDRLRAVAADTSLDYDGRIFKLDRTHQEIRRQGYLRGNDEIHPMYNLYSSLRDKLRAERDAATQPSHVLDDEDDDVFDDDDDFDDEDDVRGVSHAKARVAPSPQDILDSLLPDGFEEAGYLAKLRATGDISRSIRNDPGLSDYDRTEVGKLLKELSDRIVQEDMENNPDEWVG